MKAEPRNTRNTRKGTRNKKGLKFSDDFVASWLSPKNHDHEMYETHEQKPNQNADDETRFNYPRSSSTFRADSRSRVEFQTLLIILDRGIPIAIDHAGTAEAYTFADLG